MSHLEKFLPTENEKFLFPCIVAFFATAFFVALGFLATHWSIRWLHVTSLLLTVVSIAVGGACLVRAAYQTTFGKIKSDTHEK